jgi:hypothetical protein
VEKTSVQGQIFGHALLCLKAALSGDIAGVKKHHDEVQRHQLPKGVHPALCGRYFAAQLIYADAYSLNLEKIIFKVHQSHNHIIKQRPDKYRHFPYFEYIISPILIMIGQYQEAAFFINYAKLHFPHRHPNVDEGFYQTIDLLHATTLIKTGKKKDAEILFQQIHPSRFNFLTKKICTILYLQLSQHFRKGSSQKGEQLQDLITETGFVKLKELQPLIY